MKNFFTVLILLTACHAHADQWIQVTSMSVPRSHTSSFVIGNDAFTGCGLNYSAVNKDFWKFNSISETWTQIADLPSSERANAFGFSINGIGYLGAGQMLTAYLWDFWAYDPTTNTWSQKADFPDLRLSPVTFTIGDTGYVVAGTALSHTRDVWAYDPSSNSWTRKSDLPGPSRYRAFGFSINGKGYAGTGSDSTEQAMDDFYEYDPAADVWTAKSAYGGGLMNDGSGFVVNDVGYVTAPYDPGSTWSYSPVSDTWIQKSDFPSVTRFRPSHFAIGNFGYICGGDTGVTATYSVQGVGCWKYIPDTLDAINEYDDQNGFFFGPNPVRSLASMGMRNLETVTIYSEDGKLVFELKSFGEVIQIDCSGFAAGKYFLKATSKSSSVIHTFLKM